jgi:hypothetical protein
MNTILVSAPIANKPFNGGNAWTHLSYVFGFRKLGFDVHFVEKINPAACTNEAGEPAPIEASVNRAYFRHIAEESGLQRKMTLIASDKCTVEGVAFPELLDIAESALLLVNISGHLDVAPVTTRVRRKAYVDLDPGFTQLWQASGSNGFRITDHDYYFTVGENIGTHDCMIPANGISWRPLRQPVVLDDWPVSSGGDPSRFTTIATWRGPYGPVSHRGQTFGSKVHEFRKFAGIPGQTNGSFHIALNIDPADQKDRELLVRNSWSIADPRLVAPDLSSFRRWVQTSGAEFSVAQEMYVATKGGWFSDRTVRYLASGKPALVQDTGFTRNLPSGDGLVAFSTHNEAIAGVENIMTRYSDHAQAARRIAENYFESNRVLGNLLSQIL